VCVCVCVNILALSRSVDPLLSPSLCLDLSHTRSLSLLLALSLSPFLPPLSLSRSLSLFVMVFLFTGCLVYSKSGGLDTLVLERPVLRILLTSKNHIPGIDLETEKSPARDLMMIHTMTE